MLTQKRRENFFIKWGGFCLLKKTRLLQQTHNIKALFFFFFSSTTTRLEGARGGVSGMRNKCSLLLLLLKFGGSNLSQRNKLKSVYN